MHRMSANTTQADLERAAKLFTSGDAGGALAICDGVLRRAPGDVEALHLRALSLGRLARIDEASEAFERAASLHPAKGVVLVNYGNALKAAGRLADANAVYSRATQAAPGSSAAWNALGLACAGLGDREAARAAYGRALALEPRNAPALNNLALLEAAANRHAVAIDLFARALDIAPAMLSALINRAAALRTLGRLEESLSDATRASAIAPHSVEARAQIAASLRALGRFGEAEAAYRESLRLDPRRVDVHRDLINMLFESGEGVRAFDAIDAAIAAGGPTSLMTTKAEAALMTGDVATALAAADRAIAADPGNAAAYGMRARAMRASGEFRAARDAARRSVALAPDDFGLLHYCAEIELANGEPEAAAERLDREPPRQHLQKHIALRATAMRLAGDPAYRRYYDYDRFTAQIAIDPPTGFSSINEFNRALADAIAPLHKTSNRPVDQTLYGGTQSVGRFWNETHPVIQLYVHAMRAAAERYVRALPDDPDHPFLARKSLSLDCVGAWSVMLRSGGGHVDHIHPAGWISACYYVAAPESVLVGARAGHLRLGASGVPGITLEAERWFAPTPGTVVFFPSYIWHGVERFEAQEVRITAPFDLAPLPQHGRLAQLKNGGPLIEK
jgi:uncharacterized protein (TIGR02466 family)